MRPFFPETLSLSLLLRRSPFAQISLFVRLPSNRISGNCFVKDNDLYIYFSFDSVYAGSKIPPIYAKMNALHITNVAQVGPFLQIYGHKDRNLLNNLNENIQMYLPRLIETAPEFTQMEPHQPYLVHNPRSNKYFRCTFIEQRQPDRVTVEFIDYGNEFDVSAENVSFTICRDRLCPRLCVCVCVCSATPYSCFA